VRHSIAEGNKGWLQVAAGSISVNGQALGQGDGVAIDGPVKLEIAGIASSEFLLFDMG
jgi:redox-sensitive bicupin YhaK (pirin superfamily)